MTDNFEKKVAVDGPVVNAGELGSSTFSPGQALPAGPLGLGQRWTVARKREVVLRLLRDEPVQLLSRQLGVEIFRLEQWREKAIGGIRVARLEQLQHPHHLVHPARGAPRLAHRRRSYKPAAPSASVDASRQRRNVRSDMPRRRRPRPLGLAQITPITASVDILELHQSARPWPTAPSGASAIPPDLEEWLKPDRSSVT